MRLHRISGTSAVAAAAIVGIVAASPSYAVTTSSIGIAGPWSSSTAEVPNPASVLLSFDSVFAVVPGTGFLSGYDPVSISDLPLNRVSVLQDDAAAVRSIYAIDTSSFDGKSWKVYQNGAGDEIVFNLDTDATWRRSFDIADTDTSWAQSENGAGLLEYTGTYILPDGTSVAGTGILNASSSGEARLFENSQQAQVIPLPAGAWLLLGASGLLVGFLSRRKIRAQPELATA